MKELVEYMVRLLAIDQESVSVSQSEGDQTVMLEVRVAADDRGNLIGRQGKTIRALRTITQSAAAKHGCRAVLEIVT